MSRALYGVSISIHAPRVGSDSDNGQDSRYRRLISIHAPRVGSDCLAREAAEDCSYFNPRSPCGERPWLGRQLHITITFQSTLPVWGATGKLPGTEHPPTDFNPRSPCGERRIFRNVLVLHEQFQSTLPVWGATSSAGCQRGLTYISIHAPRVGSDEGVIPTGQKFGIFQSTLPVWGATSSTVSACAQSWISIHAPRVGSDSGSMSMTAS